MDNNTQFTAFVPHSVNYSNSYSPSSIRSSRSLRYSRTLSYDGKPSPDNPQTPTLLRRSSVLTNNARSFVGEFYTTTFGSFIRKKRTNKHILIKLYPDSVRTYLFSFSLLVRLALILRREYFLVGTFLGVSLWVKYTEKLEYLYFITYIGILTSLLNHGTYHTTFYKWLDRCAIFLGVFVYMYYIFLMDSSFRKAIALSIILAMIVIYFYSKSRKYRAKEYTHIHSVCHFLSVILFTLIVLFP